MLVVIKVSCHLHKIPSTILLYEIHCKNMFWVQKKYFPIRVVFYMWTRSICSDLIKLHQNVWANKEKIEKLWVLRLRGVAVPFLNMCCVYLKCTSWIFPYPIVCTPLLAFIFSTDYFEINCRRIWCCKTCWEMQKQDIIWNFHILKMTRTAAIYLV